MKSRVVSQQLAFHDLSLETNNTMVVKATNSAHCINRLYLRAKRKHQNEENLVPSMVIFLRIEDACRWASGPDAGSEFLSDIMFVMSSESLTASLYSLTQESPEDAIG
ncbi:Spc97 / Spc98 family of spindle pole body (SBP)component [Striga asiatica]|uniref:Spc97 / Spc98 family of spindle pole body (SBP)component n=1 Tax=Striga asiatica TaxID=4170 RepID=A0A5A7QQV4_STRAF|nr:Spc97 / Spc98 family of spindle pole body (SBP)component [Striga asiatica]